jgi:hypothetical protein
MAGQRESVTKRGPPFLALVAAAAVVTAVWGMTLHSMCSHRGPIEFWV